MKALFLVNGTGMGHITQTFALVELFAQHETPFTPVAVMATNCAWPKLVLLREYYRCPVVEAPSLRFHTNAAGEISPWRTAWGSLCDIGDCLGSVARLHALVAETKPDVVINFYEALGGFYHLRHRATTPWISVAHQFMVHHPSYVRHASLNPQRHVLKMLTSLTGLGSKLRIALSFYPAKSHGNIVVTAPLLRQQVLNATIRTGNYILCYLNNGTHLPKLLRYCQRHPDQLVRCFCPDHVDTSVDNLEMHRPDWTRYLEALAGCRGLIATSGFESVAEAAVLGKPSVVIPLKNQLEQELNAQDGLRHRLTLHAVHPEDEIPDTNWQPTRAADEYRQFVVTENRRLCHRIMSFLQTHTVPTITGTATATHVSPTPTIS